MKLPVLERCNPRWKETEESSETNETLLEKGDAYWTTEARSKPFIKVVLAVSVALNIISLVVGLARVWKREPNNDPFRQWYSE